MRTFEIIAKAITDRGLNKNSETLDLMAAIAEETKKLFPDDYRTARFVLNHPDFVGDVLGEIGA